VETARLQVDLLRDELRGLHHHLARRDVEMLSVLSRLTASTDRLRLSIEQDRGDQRRLTRAVELLALFATGPDALSAPEPTATVIGGRVEPARGPAPAVPLVPEDDTLPPAATAPLDLTADPESLPVAPTTRAESPLQCEVHLQFGDRWIDGFQIEETIRAGDRVQFRLRRRVDGWVLPELFDEAEVRVFTQPVTT
jgi:hypothetical protein